MEVSSMKVTCKTCRMFCKDILEAMKNSIIYFICQLQLVVNNLHMKMLFQVKSGQFFVRLGCPCARLQPNRNPRKPGFPTRSDTNQPVQYQNNARFLKFWIQVEEELYYLCSENSYCTADLHLCFCLYILLVFSCGGSILIMLM